MAIIETTRLSSFENWRIDSNRDSANLGDVDVIYSSDTVSSIPDTISNVVTDTFGSHRSVVLSLNDLNNRKVRRLGDTIGWLNVTGAFTGSTGTFSSTLGVTGNLSINTNKFTVTAASGDTAFAGNLAINTNKFTVTAASGNTNIAGTLGVTSDLAINTNKFTVTAASGNTSIAGTLGVTGAASLSSTLGVTGNLSINTNKFTVTAATGNTNIAGTLGVTGNLTLSGTNNAVGTVSSGIWQGSAIGAAYGGTGLSSIGSANYIVGVNSAGSSLEYKSIAGGSGINVTNSSGSITITTDGTLPAGSSTDTYFRVGQNLSVGSYLWYQTSISGAAGQNTITVGSSAGLSNGMAVSGPGIAVGTTVITIVGNTVTLSTNTIGTVSGTGTFTGHNSINTGIALEVKPGMNSSYTRLFSVKTANDGSGETFYVDHIGNVTSVGNFVVGANKLTVNASTGTTSIAGNLNVSTDFAINTNKFNVTGSSGDIYSAGTISQGAILQGPVTPLVGASGTLDTFPHGTYKSVKYLIQISNSAGFEICELLVISNGADTFTTEYGRAGVPTAVVFSSTISGGNTIVSWSGSATSATIKAQKTYIAA